MSTSRKQTALRILAVVFSLSLMVTYVACNSSPESSPEPFPPATPEGAPGDNTAPSKTQHETTFDLNDALSKTGTVRPPRSKNGESTESNGGGGSGGGEGGLFD